MIAEILRQGSGGTARFERHLKHPVDSVWAYLTENDKLASWFPELRVDSLREGGVILFDMQNGTYETMTILDMVPHAVLEYTWDKDKVRFELSPEQDGTRLVLIETISEWTDHTPRDLAGWHVCLDVIEALLDGRTIESRKDRWNIWYKQYVEAGERARG
ncbi:SRPBCC family protein [Paenibacillus sp. NPDC056579]|uniref:SRPBCC family protein n=1 Tax=Paenibacillus sp. NPDC056579 TaxID=3345871 RepID=UPI0036D1097B